MIVKIAVGGVIAFLAVWAWKDPYIFEMAKEKRTRRSAVSQVGR